MVRILANAVEAGVVDVVAEWDGAVGGDVYRAVD
jgi:hypothetical protein